MSSHHCDCASLFTPVRRPFAKLASFMWEGVNPHEHFAGWKGTTSQLSRHNGLFMTL